MSELEKELMIQQIDGRAVVPSVLLEKLMQERDQKIRRIKQATETMHRLQEAKTIDEYNAVQIPAEFRVFGKYAATVMGSYVSGFAMADEDGTPRCYYGNMGAPASILFPTLYRGELSDYGSTSGYSLLGRIIRSCHHEMDVESKYTFFFIEQIKRMVFLGFLNAFRQYREFPFGEPMDGPIAQHYGLNTQFIDLTDDLKVALFFASCKHMGDSQYRPIREEELDELGKYGVLYEGTHSWAKAIGYQPFCRCHRQRGYCIDTAGAVPCWEYSLNPGTGFQKYYFERTVELSERLCAEFNGGRKLFPNDGLIPFSKAIQQIRNMKKIPFRAFKLAHRAICGYLEANYRNKKISDTMYNAMLKQEYWEERLKKAGYNFCEQIELNADPELIRKLNEQWNPYEYAQKEGINYTPFIVMSADPITEDIK